MSLKSTIKSIKEAGFGYLKVELEAQLDRGDEDEGYYDTCDDCSGDGYHECSDCNGEGSTLTAMGETLCTDCSGHGTSTCEECGGEGERYVEPDSDFGSVYSCEEFLRDNVSEEARKALVYDKFYNDGSVDSEYTFTIPVEKAHILPEFIEAFNKLAEEIGNGMDVEGAGMHIAVIPTASEGRYPCTNPLDLGGLTNFTSEVTKLLPALFIASTSGNFTRSLGYRYPRVGTDKYSAIHIINSSVLEFRLFETCYQRPDAVFEFLQTISRTLEFYTDPNKKVETQGKTFEFYDDESIEGFTSTPEQVRVLKKQLKMVIGKKVTLRSFAEKRELDLSVGKRSKQFNKRVAELKKLYKEAQKDFENKTNRPANERELEEISSHQRWGYFDDRDYTDAEKLAYVRGITNIGTEEEFIKQNLMQRSPLVVLSV